MTMNLNSYLIGQQLHDINSYHQLWHQQCLQWNHECMDEIDLASAWSFFELVAQMMMHYVWLNNYYFADRLKQFRRQLDIYEGVMVHFMKPNNNTTFHLHFTPPLERETCGRPRRSTRNYVFTIDITQPMISHATPLVWLYWCHKCLFCLLIS